MGALLLALSLLLPGGQQEPFQESLAATARGAFGRALEHAEDPRLEPSSRAQARLWVFYTAGLLDLALAEAEATAVESPGDPWLHEQATRIAISLHHPAAAAAHLSAWDASAGAGPRPDEQIRAEVATLVSSDRRRSGGLKRARIVSLALLATCGVLLASLLRGGSLRGGGKRRA